MQNAFIVASLVTISGLSAGCGASDEAKTEPVASSEDPLIGVLTSPIGVEDEHLNGTWVPVDGDQFEGGAAAAKTIVFAKSELDGRSYRLRSPGQSECSPESEDGACEKNGTWFRTANPVVWFFAGTYVTFQPASDPNAEKSLFIWRKADGEIRLVDLNTWSWSQLSYRNTWRKTPALTVNDL